MEFKILKCKTGVIKHFVIDAQGTVSCLMDTDYCIPTRKTGKGDKLYMQVHLLFRGILRWFYVHRLMAYSWHGPSRHKLLRIVDHRDSNSLNNCVDNLRWVTILANNINKKCIGIVQIEDTELYAPKISGFTHKRFADTDIELVQELRKHLVECYIRYNTRYPENGNNFPHSSIHNY